MKPKVTDLKLGKDEAWITITLPWSAVRTIEKALELVDKVGTSKECEDVTIRVGKEFVVQYKKEGIVVSYSDWDSLPDVEELLDARPEGSILCATCQHADVCERAAISVESCNFHREFELENRLAKNTTKLRNAECNKGTLEMGGQVEVPVLGSSIMELDQSDITVCRHADACERAAQPKIKEGGPDFGCLVCQTLQLPDCGGKCKDQ